MKPIQRLDYVADNGYHIYDPMRYYLCSGTVQPYVCRQGDANTTMFFHMFGRPEYDRRKPIISESISMQAQPIVDQLNASAISEAEACVLLDKIYF